MIFSLGQGFAGSGISNCRSSQLSGSARMRSRFLKPCNKFLPQLGLAHIYPTSFFSLSTAALLVIPVAPNDPIPSDYKWSEVMGGMPHEALPHHNA